MTRAITRRQALFVPLLATLALAACGQNEAPIPHDFKPLTYNYLPVIHLSVGSIAVENHATVIANDFSSQSPVLPVDALTRMAEDRLSAGGNTGRALFVIDQASLVHTDTGLLGTFIVHLSIQDASGQDVGYAQAQVVRTYTGDLSDLQGTLYDMTKAMMDDMNVELELAIRRNLGNWLQSVSTAPAAAPVQTESLPPLAPAPTTTTSTTTPTTTVPPPVPVGQ